jgi:hypothetical protein
VYESEKSIVRENDGVNFPPRCTSLVHVTKRGNKNKMITGIIKDNDAEIQVMLVPEYLKISKSSANYDFYCFFAFNLNFLFNY